MTRCFLAVVFGCALLWSQPSQPRNWTVAGTVIDSSTAQPIPGALVVWEPSFASYGFRDRPIESDAPSSNAARMTTDSSGAFTFAVDGTATGVRLFVSRSGYRTQDGKTAAALAVRAGTTPVAVRLVPQSSIQGRITTASGDAIPGIGVNLTRTEIHDGRRQPRQTYAKVTGQNGEFSFDDLPPGAFYVRAAGSKSGDASGETYGPVYYPAAFTEDEARLLRVAPGKAITADFHLESHQAYRIRGIVTNMPLRRPVTIRLLRRDDPLSNPAPVSPNGTFEVSGVAPGAYTLQAYTPDLVPLNLGEVAVTVENRDTNAVKVTLSEGADIAGHIEFRGPGSLDQYAVVYATPFYPRRWPGDVKESVAVMNTKGNFVLKNLQPGKYDISVRSLPNFYLSELHAIGRSGLQDVDRGLTVSAADPPALAIVMKSGASEITGTIEGAGIGDLFSIALVVMRGAVAIPTVMRATDGHFHVSGLTPGDYTLLAWPDAREVEYRNPAVLTDLLSHGTSVSVAEGSRRNITVNPVP